MSLYLQSGLLSVLKILILSLWNRDIYSISLISILLWDLTFSYIFNVTPSSFLPLICCVSGSHLFCFLTAVLPVACVWVAPTCPLGLSSCHFLSELHQTLKQSLGFVLRSQNVLFFHNICHDFNGLISYVIICLISSPHQTPSSMQKSLHMTYSSLGNWQLTK